MRVAIASRIYPPEVSAASFRLGALTDALLAQGDQVVVLTTSAPIAPPTDEVADVRRFPVLRDKSGYVRGYLPYLSFDLPLFFRLLFLRRPDVVVVEPPPTSGLVTRLVCALRRIPFVYYAADIWSDAVESMDTPSIVDRELRRVETAVLRDAASVLAVSEGVAERVLELAPRARITVVGNGVDTGIFEAAGTVESDGRYAIYPGTMSEWQGADIFIRALPTVLREVPDARLLFLGQGSARAELEALVSELGVDDAVEFRDPLPPEEAASLIRGSSLGLVSLKPGQGYDFAIPTKLYAILASGAPALFAGAALGPAALLVRSAPEAGSAVFYDVDRVAESMAELLSRARDQTARTRLAAWARDNVSIASVARRTAREVRAVAEAD